MVAENVVTGGAFPWDSLLIVGAAWYVGRRINAMKRPVCNGGCAGCHGARRGRGCAFPNGPGNRRDVR